ncbi:MAG TPA: hypothetical protein VMW95_02680 [Desulfobacterales bacterium]|nr:hypothetical protein [Desulfobacterales bacterium]
MTKRRQSALQYKCRRCGDIIDGGMIPNDSERNANNIWISKIFNDARLMIGIHNCDDGNLGITDLIGAEFNN